MIAPEVVEFRLAITAPPCAPLPVDDVVIVGAAAAVCVGGTDTGIAPPPHPHSRALNMKPSITIRLPARILMDSRSRRGKLRSFRRNHETTAACIRQTRARRSIARLNQSEGKGVARKTNGRE